MKFLGFAGFPVYQVLNNSDPPDKKVLTAKQLCLLGGLGRLLFSDTHYDLSAPKGSWIVLQAINIVTQRNVDGRANQYGQKTGLADIESVIEDAADVFTGRIDGVIMTPFYSREILGTRLIVRFELDPELLDNASFRTVVHHALIRLQRAMAHLIESGEPQLAGSLMEFAHNAFFNWPDKTQHWVRLSEFTDRRLAPPLDSR